MSTPTIDFSQYEQKAAPDANQIDFSKYETNAPTNKSVEEPGILDRDIPLTSYGNATLSGLQSVGRGVRDSVEGIGHMIAHPIDTAKSIADLPYQAAEVPGAIHDINQSADPLGTYAKVGQETAGQGAGQALTALGAEFAPKAVGMAGRGARALKPMLGKAVTFASDVVDPDITGIVSPRLASAQRVLGRAGKALSKTEPAPVFPGAPFPENPGVFPGAPFPENPGVFPGAHLPEHPGTFSKVPLGPEAPPPDVLRAAPLSRGAQSMDVTDPALTQSRSLGQRFMGQPAGKVTGEPLPTDPKFTEDGEKLAVQFPPAQPETPEPIAEPPSSRAALGRTLDDKLGNALGASRIRPGVKIRDQFKTESAPVEEGHTPVAKSDVVKSFKYDAAKQEMHVTTKAGGTYVAGEVTPEQAEAFKNADSKGKAWNELRKSSTPVAKILNGKRIAVKPTNFRSVSPDDLTDVLKDSVELAKKKRETLAK